MSSEFEKIVLQKFDEINGKLEHLDNKIDAVEENLNNKIDSVEESLNNKIDAVNDNLNKKIDYVDAKQTEKSDSIMSKLNYMSNNVAKILEEQIKMREEMKEYNQKNEKEHRMFEYEIANLKRYVV